MSEREIILKLARVIIAVAWSDGEMSNDEVNCLKDLLFTLRQSGFDDVLQISGQEWARLDMYIETPVDESERARLVADLQNALRSPEEKQFALDALQRMAEADGVISDSEKDAVAAISEAIESVEMGFLGGIQRVVGGAMQRRADAVAGAPNREAYFDDFIKNKVYYSVSQRLRDNDRELSISDEDLRRLSLVGGLMAKIAQLDRQVTEAEFESMINIIQNNWNLGLEEATFVTEVAVSSIDVTYDTFRMMREIATGASIKERQRVLLTLFAVANSDGDMSFDEIEEIRVIARGLDLSHKDFIDAKLKVLGERRPGQK
jgi:tellurite resistance protein